MSTFVFQRVINVVSCKVQPNFKIFCNMKKHRLSEMAYLKALLTAEPEGPGF